jgi:hypothetical protein
MAEIRCWPASCCDLVMLRKTLRLLLIKNRFEAYAVIYALAVGATGRGVDYMSDYPAPWGILLFVTCTLAVFMAGAKILDGTQPKWRGNERRGKERIDRRSSDPGDATICQS